MDRHPCEIRQRSNTTHPISLLSIYIYTHIKSPYRKRRLPESKEPTNFTEPLLTQHTDVRTKLNRRSTEPEMAGLLGAQTITQILKRNHAIAPGGLSHRVGTRTFCCNSSANRQTRWHVFLLLFHS